MKKSKNNRPLIRTCRAKLLVKSDLIESYSFKSEKSDTKAMVTFFKSGEIPDPGYTPIGVMSFEGGTAGFEHPFICKMIDGFPRIMVILDDKSNSLAYSIVDTNPEYIMVERPVKTENIGTHIIHVPGPTTINIHVRCLFNGFPTLLKLSYTSII